MSKFVTGLIYIMVLFYFQGNSLSQEQDSHEVSEKQQEQREEEMIERLADELLAPSAEEEKEKKEVANASDATPLREITVAVLPIGATEEVRVDPDALSDQVNVLMATLPSVTLVDRAEIERVAEEQQLALSGMVDLESAVRIGNILSAQYIMVGRASKIGETYYLVLRLINVETTKMTTIAAKGPAEDPHGENFLEKRGMEVVLENLEPELARKIKTLQTTPLDAETLQKINQLREMLEPFAGKRMLIDVVESHVSREIGDPATQMVITHFLNRLDIEFVVPKDPASNWKEKLLQTARYEDQSIDYLVEGQGVSEFAGRIQGMISCRARVELRLIPLPGKRIMAIDRGVAAGVDLTESLSSKMALEKASVNAIESLLVRAANQLQKTQVREE